MFSSYQPEAEAAARSYQLSLTKPAGSLGLLEDLACWYAGARGRFEIRPAFQPAIVLFAADHGVVAEGVSAYPPSVTAAMVANMLAGGAAINTLARRLPAPLHVVDIGVASPIPPVAPSAGVTFHSRKIRSGTGNLRREVAMSRAEAERAVGLGRELAGCLITKGATVLALGEMGIGNTTPAAALTSVFTGHDPIETVGRGTGVADEALERKRTVVRESLDLHRPNPSDPIGVLSQVGGLEFAAMAGAMLESAARQVPVMLDGYLANASALVAMALEPSVMPFLRAGHRSAEPGADHALKALGLRPLLQLDMRLGEGSGAALALQLLATALDLQAGMATFESAGVNGPV